MITRPLILSLGLSQLILWGISFYLIGVFGDLIAADLGWSRTLVHGGFSAALLVMAATSPFVGSLIDRLGGRQVMITGSLLCALGCGLLYLANTIPIYYLAWVILGVAMRCCLYDAAFATLARIAGPAAKRPIALITLLGGLAASCFWPIGHFLAEWFGWRGAVLIYAIIAIFTVPLHIIIPDDRHGDTEGAARVADHTDSPEHTPKSVLFAAILYATIIALGNGLHAGMSSHLIGVLSGLGLGATMAVFVAALRGVGQTTARLIEIVTGSRLHPVSLNLFAALLMPASFALGLAGAGNVTAAIVFVFTSGGATGLLTITRGTLPLVLFDTRTYGAFTGKLLVPSFVLSAAAPIIFAWVIDQWGAEGAMILSIATALIIVAASLALKSRSLNPAHKTQ